MGTFSCCARCYQLYTICANTCHLAAEYEFFQFRAPKSSNEGPGDVNSSATMRFLSQHKADTLPHLTEGMMGYSLTDTNRNSEWFYNVYEACEKFDCGIEGWHTESGPGVFEAVSRELSRVDHTCKTLIYETGPQLR